MRFEHGLEELLVEHAKTRRTAKLSHSFEIGNSRHKQELEAIMSWLPKKTVVVPVDFSTASADALKTGLELVAKPEDLHVIYVTAPPIAFNYAEGWALDDPTTRMKSAHEHLAKFFESTKTSGVQAIIREGDPGLMIADYAAEVHADLIVMPSHGYHGVKRLLLGSVAERVLHHATCPVLVLRRSESE